MIRMAVTYACRRDTLKRIYELNVPVTILIYSNILHEGVVHLTSGLSSTAYN